jgi:hypothetical protein
MDILRPEAILRIGAELCLWSLQPLLHPILETSMTQRSGRSNLVYGIVGTAPLEIADMSASKADLLSGSRAEPPTRDRDNLELFKYVRLVIPQSPL